MRKVTLEVKFLGGTREVGRTAFLVKTDRAEVLLDYGVMMGRPPRFPMHVARKNLNALLLTHCHLDHSGGLPIFYIQDKLPLYSTGPTLELLQVLIKDFIHLSGYYLPFEYLELRYMMDNCVASNYGEEHKAGDISFKFVNAGHIPGSAQILLEAEGKRLLFTGDFNSSATRLLSPAFTDYGDLDAMIIETTYANEDHPDRMQLEKEFIDDVNNVVESGGTVLVPAFSIGRSQEIACILAAHHFKHPVAIDGMARKVNRIILDFPKFVQDPQLTMNALHGATWVEGWRDRRRISRKPGVIISPAGMLQGGPAAFYIARVGKQATNSIYLVSYQIPGTPGRELLETGKCTIDGKLRKTNAQVKHFDFSSHSGASQLKESIESLSSTPKVFAVHGDEKNCERIARWTKKKVGFEAFAPKAGDTFII